MVSLFGILLLYVRIMIITDIILDQFGNVHEIAILSSVSAWLWMIATLCTAIFAPPSGNSIGLVLIFEYATPF